MPRTKAASSPSTATSTPKTRRAPAMTERKRTRVAPKAAVAPFDLDAHRDEIAQAAYLNWLSRGGSDGSAEQDWLMAESSVRAKYASV